MALWRARKPLLTERRTFEENLPDGEPAATYDDDSGMLH
jgi:hypothetical protein